MRGGLGNDIKFLQLELNRLDGNHSNARWAVFTVLLGFRNERNLVWTSNPTIQNYAGYSRNPVRQSLADLIRIGAIEEFSRAQFELIYQEVKPDGTIGCKYNLAPDQKIWLMTGTATLNGRTLTYFYDGGGEGVVSTPSEGVATHPKNKEKHSSLSVDKSTRWQADLDFTFCNSSDIGTLADANQLMAWVLLINDRGVYLPPNELIINTPPSNARVIKLGKPKSRTKVRYATDSGALWAFVDTTYLITHAVYGLRVKMATRARATAWDSFNRVWKGERRKELKSISVADFASMIDWHIKQGNYKDTSCFAWRTPITIMERFYTWQGRNDQSEILADIDQPAPTQPQHLPDIFGDSTHE